MNDNDKQDGIIEEEYWGIKSKKIWDLKALFDTISAKYPDIKGTRDEHETLGDQLRGAFCELTTLNIPIQRKGLGFVLTTDTGIVIGNGKFNEKLKDIPMGGMDYHINEVLTNYNEREQSE